MITCPCSIFFAWASIKGFRKALLDIQTIFNDLNNKYFAEKNQLFSFNFLSQPFSSFAIYSITLIPYEILSNQSSSFLSSYAIIQKFSLLPLFLYNNYIFINQRNKLIYGLADQIKRKKNKTLENKLQNKLYIVAAISILINYFYYLYDGLLYVSLLSTTVAVFLSVSSLKLEIFNWLNPSKIRVVKLIPSLLLTSIFFLISDLHINYRITLFIFHMLMIYFITHISNSKQTSIPSSSMI